MARPLASRPIEVTLPDGRTLHGTTDAAGKYHVTFATDSFGEEQALGLTARLPQDNVASSAVIRVALRGFDVALKTTRGTYLDGESVPLEITTTDAQGQPVGEALSATLIKQVTVDGRVTERDVLRQQVSTQAGTGRAAVVFRAEDQEGGPYVLRVAGTDRFGTPIVADHPIQVSGKKDPTRLRLLSDRTRFKVGEDARVDLHSRGRAGTALVTWEADRILSYRIVELKEGDNSTAWAVANAEFPNFTLTATRMWEDQLDEARLDVQVERDLRVLVKPVKPIVGPGEPIELDVTTVDQLGRPVAAELSIAMIDRSLLRLFEDRHPEIGAYFYNQTRTGAFANASTNTFHYPAATIPVPQAVVEESERSAAMAANAADRVRVLEQAKAEEPALPPVPNGQGGQGQNHMAGLNAPAPAADAAASSPAGRRSTFAVMNPATALFGDAEKSRLYDAESNRAPAKSRLRQARKRDARPDAPSGGESRERFVESAYWNPAVVTGKDGKARVTFKAPPALSEYRITARGVTGSDTLAGQTTATLTVKKSFFVDLKAPAALTQGDRPRFVAQVHHQGVKGRITLRLAAYAGGRDDVLAREIDVRGDGVDEVVFDPYEVPEGDTLRLTLTAAAGERKDELIVEVPIRPWGVPVFASASGTSRDGTTVFLGLPAGRSYENPEMIISLAPTVRRMLVELALTDDAMPFETDVRSASARCMPPATNTTADRAAGLLGATSVRRYLGEAGAANRAETERLTRLIRGYVSELVAAQNPDGGWPWVTAGTDKVGQNNVSGNQPSDRMTSAAVYWALADAEGLGLLTEPKVLEQGTAYIRQEFARVADNDWETRAAMLHALSDSTRRRLRSGQHPEPLARSTVGLGTRLPGADVRQPRAAHHGRRAHRSAGPTGEVGGDGPRPTAEELLGSSRPFAVRSVGRRDHCARDTRLRPRPARSRRAATGRQLAERASRGHLEPGQGQRAGPGRTVVVLRPSPIGRGSLSPDGHRQRCSDRRARRPGAGREPGHHRPSGRDQARTNEPRPLRRGGSRRVRVLGRALGVHSRPQTRTIPCWTRRLGRATDLFARQPRAGRQDPAGGILGRSQPIDLREPRQPGRPRWRAPASR